jgi:hypothetical protein
MQFFFTTAITTEHLTSYDKNGSELAHGDGSCALDYFMAL